MKTIPTDLVRRPDGSYVSLSDLPPREQLGHDLVMRLYPKSLALSEKLRQLKVETLTEMRAFRDMMLEDYGITVGGKEGGFSLKTVDGTMKVELAVSPTISFGPELLAAKELLDEFLIHELEGSSEIIVEIVTSAFRLNSKGRIDTGGILNLRKHNYTHPTWMRAMQAIEDAIIKDSKTTYIRFHSIDPETKTEEMVRLDIAKVPLSDPAKA